MTAQIGIFGKIIGVLIMLAATANSAGSQVLPAELKGHGGPIKSVHISPDGERVLTASFDYSILYWDITGEEAKIIHRLEGHDAAVNDAVFMPNLLRAVSVSDDGTLGVWDLETGKLVYRINAPRDKVLDVAVSKNGKFAAVARWDETVRLYDLEWQKEIAVLKGHRGNVNSVVFSSDDRFVYSAAYDGQILEWEVETARFVRPIHRHGWGINSITLLDEGRILYGALDGTVAVVSIEKAQRVLDIAKRDRPIQSVKRSPDGALANITAQA